MVSMSHPDPEISMLLVEDEEITLKLLATILTKKFSGITLYTAINGKAGLELFESHTPDIVITDVNMPEMNGIQMAKEIRAIKPDTKFIVITGDTGKIALQDSIGNEFAIDNYLVKPVRFEALFEAIEQCLGKIAQLN